MTTPPEPPEPLEPRDPSGSLGPLGRVAAWVGARATHGDPPAVLATIGQHRRLFRAWLPFATVLLARTTLPRRDVELVILRTALNTSSAYEWAQHVPLAAAAGLDAPALDDVVEGAAADRWSPRQRALLVATDELHHAGAIAASTWATLADHLGRNELLELCFLVGHYEMLAMTLNSFDVLPEPSALRRLGAAPAKIAAQLHARIALQRASDRSPFTSPAS